MPIATPVEVTLKSNPEIVGTMVDLSVLTMQTPAGPEIVIRAAVCWEAENMRSPCPSFHAPEELSFLGLPLVDAAFDDEEDEDFEEGEAGEEEGEPTEGGEPTPEAH